MVVTRAGSRASWMPVKITVETTDCCSVEMAGSMVVKMVCSVVITRAS